VGLLAPVATADAQQRVIVEAFSGPRGATLRNSFVQDLRQNGIEVIENSEVSAAASQLGIRARRLNETSCAQVAEEVNAAACISGRVNRARRRWSVAVRIRNGADGASLGSRSWGGRTAAALGAIGRSGYSRISQFLAQAQAPATPASEGETEWYAEPAVPEPLFDPELEEEEDDGPLEGREAMDRFVVRLGVGTLRRSLITTAGACARGTGCTAENGTVVPEDRRYVSAGLGSGELGVAITLFPGLLSDDRPVPWLGLHASYHYGLFVNTEGFAANGSMLTVDTTQSELYVGAKGFFRLGDTLDETHLSVDLGYGMFGFEFDLDQLAMLNPAYIIPSISYSYIHIGLGARYGVVPQYFILEGRAAFRLGLGLGDDARAIWGVNSYMAPSFSFGAEIISEAPYLGEGFFFSLAVDYHILRSQWRGNTECRMAGCGPGDLWESWPYTVEMGGGDNQRNNLRPGAGITDTVSDGYLRLHLSLGYSLR